MGKHNFETLDELKNIIRQYEDFSDGNKDMAGMGTLTILASAILKLAEEIEQLKQAD